MKKKNEYIKKMDANIAFFSFDCIIVESTRHEAGAFACRPQ